MEEEILLEEFTPAYKMELNVLVHEVTEHQQTHDVKAPEPVRLRAW